MKYTEAEVLDIIKSTTDKDPKEILSLWDNKKANTLLYPKNKYNQFVYTFPIIIENKEVGEITLADLYNNSSSRDDLMMKYLGKENFDISYCEFSHDTYLFCYLTIHEEFKLPEICKGMYGDTLQGIDASGRPFEYQISYGNPEKEKDSYLYSQWTDKAYRFDNDVNIIVSKMSGWTLGEKTNENIEKRLIPYRREEKLDNILHNK